MPKYLHQSFYKIIFFWRFWAKNCRQRAPKNCQNGDKLPHLVTQVTRFNSAARNFEQKVSKFMKTPKDLQKINFKISKGLPKVKNIYIKAQILY